MYTLGSFYYTNQDAHYKHGRPVTWAGCENDARRECLALNERLEGRSNAKGIQ